MQLLAHRSSALSLRHRAGGYRRYCLDDFPVTGAAAQIARDGMADLRFARPRILVEQRLGGEHNAWCAEAALRTAMLDERLLQRMQFAAGGKPLDRRDAAARHLDSQNQARVDGDAVHQPRAGAAIPVATPFLGAG